MGQPASSPIQHSIWCLVYGNDPVSDRFKVTVGSLKEVDVSDLKNIIFPYATTSLDEGPAFKLGLYKATHVPGSSPGFGITEVMSHPEKKLSEHWFDSELKYETLHVVVVLPSSRQRFEARMNISRSSRLSYM